MREATLSVRPGEAVAIMGPSGSGKSTLLCIMGGLLRPDSGDVRVNGVALEGLGPRRLAEMRSRTIGFVFQRFNLLRALSASENVEVSLRLTGCGRRRARAAAERFLASLGLAERARSLPRDLSGGEQQRVAIARALVTSPTLILADEPTANLDSRNGRAVIDMLSAHVRSHRAAAVIVTHDLRVATAVDRQLLMEDGVVKEA